MPIVRSVLRAYKHSKYFIEWCAILAQPRTWGQSPHGATVRHRACGSGTDAAVGSSVSSNRRDATPYHEFVFETALRYLR